VTRLRQPMWEELQRPNYSQATTRGYLLAVKQFAEYFGQSPEKLGADEIRHYQLYLLNEKKLTPGTVEIRMSALRFLYMSDAISPSMIWSTRRDPKTAGRAESPRSDTADRSNMRCFPFLRHPRNTIEKP
jgi:Phage integrase, N-terminal SAM-like domain